MHWYRAKVGGSAGGARQVIGEPNDDLTRLAAVLAVPAPSSLALLDEGLRLARSAVARLARGNAALTGEHAGAAGSRWAH